MNADIKKRLKSVSDRLHMRAIEHSPGPDPDTAMLLQATAIQMEALLALAADLKALEDEVARR